MKDALDSPTLDEARLRRLLDVGRSLVSELDVDVVLENVLEAARDITEAKYAALGVLDEAGDSLERFLTLGIDEPTRRIIGDLPRGHGVLGVLIRDPKPLRLGNVGSHPQSYGFPAGHPPMKTFLGVPIRTRETVYGNLYLTEKAGGDFTAADEETVGVLADWAGIAIQNARLYQQTAERRDELQRAVAAFEASLAVARAVGGETELDRILELIVKRGRALVEARSMFVALEAGGRVVVNAVAGELDRTIEGSIVPLEGPLAKVMESRRPLHLQGSEGDSVSPLPGVEADAALMVPLVYRDMPVGVLCALDPMSLALKFSKDAERVLEAFASSGATAVATGRNVAEQRAKRSIEATESERRRWARELHDETLQDMASLKLILSSARRSKDPAAIDKILDEAIEQITHGIASLRNLVNDLRPPVLDEAGVKPALESLAARVGGLGSLEVRLKIDLPHDNGDSAKRLTPQIEDTVYRVVQEALTNVVKHAAASRAEVSVIEHAERLDVVILDDGVGIGLGSHQSDGFGLLGMRERVEIVGGTLTITSSDDGTRVHATIPPAR